MVYTDFGTLSISTSAASGALPISESIVVIRGADEFNRDVIYSLITDEDGITEAIRLPAPSASYSQAPNPKEVPYALYDVEISKEGYYTKKIRDIAIFADINTNLPVNMIPFVVYNEGGSYPRGNINAIVIENQNL